MCKIKSFILFFSQNSDICCCVTDPLFTGRSFVQPVLPLVVTELVAVVISWDNVNEKDVFGLGVHATHFNLVARKHPPVKENKKTFRHTHLLICFIL